MVEAMLIPGLPEEVAFLCLLRVPRRFHRRMQAVCRRWRKLLQDSEFFRARASSDLAEAWIYALVSENHVAHSNSYTASISLRAFDLQAKRWLPVPGIPLPFSRAAQVQAQVVQGKLVLCGGCSEGIVLSDVAVYDPCVGRWSKGQPMRHARASFISAAIRDQLYVLGGEADHVEAITMERYDLEQDRWTAVEVMDSVGMTGWESVRPRPAVVVGHQMFIPRRPRPEWAGPLDSHQFCAESGAWSTVRSNMFSWWQFFDPFVVSNGLLYGPVPLPHLCGNLADISVYNSCSDTWRVIPQLAKDFSFTRRLSSLVDLGDTLGAVMNNFTVAIAVIDTREPMTMKLEWLCSDECQQLWWNRDVILSCHVVYV